MVSSVVCYAWRWLRLRFVYRPRPVAICGKIFDRKYYSKIFSHVLPTALDQKRPSQISRVAIKNARISFANFNGRNVRFTDHGFIFPLYPFVVAKTIQNRNRNQHRQGYHFLRPSNTSAALDIVRKCPVIQLWILLVRGQTDTRSNCLGNCPEQQLELQEVNSRD